MKLSEFKDEAALELLAEIIEPASVLFSDAEVKKAIAAAYKGGGSPAAAVSLMLKTHQREVLAIMAALDCVPLAEYHCNVLTLPTKLLEILNDEELMAFFVSQAEDMTQSASSGLHSENSEGEK